MEIKNLKEWLDNGYVISKHTSDEVVSFRKYKDGSYRVFKGSTTIENCKRVEEKNFDVFLEETKKILGEE